MDFFVAARFLEYYGNQRAPAPAPPSATSATAPAPPPGPAPFSTSTFQVLSLGGIIALIVGIFIGIAAMFLSWTCNTAIDYPVWMRSFFAFFAFILGTSYILLYIIMRHDTCRYIKKNMFI